MKPSQIITLCIVAVGLLLASFFAGCRYADRDHIEQVLEKVRVDTVYYARPTCVSSVRKPFLVNVPRLRFVVRDSVVKDSLTTAPGNYSEFPTCSADSVALLVDVETRIYEDTLYRAQVSGPTLGELRPTLDWVQVCDRTVYTTQTVSKRNRFAITAGVGAAYTPAGFQPTIGVQVGVILWSF